MGETASYRPTVRDGVEVNGIGKHVVIDDYNTNLLGEKEFKKLSSTRLMTFQKRGICVSAKSDTPTVSNNEAHRWKRRATPLKST